MKVAGNQGLLGSGYLLGEWEFVVERGRRLEAGLATKYTVPNELHPLPKTLICYQENFKVQTTRSYVFQKKSSKKDVVFAARIGPFNVSP